MSIFDADFKQFLLLNTIIKKKMQLTSISLFAELNELCVVSAYPTLDMTLKNT